MTRYQVLTTRDAARWREALPADLHVMGCVEYCRIMERHTGQPARLFVLERDGAPVAAYPFFLRGVDGLPFAAGTRRGLVDTVSPEYTGPVVLRPDLLEAEPGAAFADRFAEWCRAEGVVAEFAHLDPWVDPELLAPECVEVNRPIVWVDLTWPEQELLMRSLVPDARRQMHQAERAGVRVRVAEEAADVLEFYRLYTDTMVRRHALRRYYFPAEFFLALHEEMEGHARILLAELQGKVIAGGLWLFGDTRSFWHLSAMDLEYGRVRPVNACVWEMMRWSARAGVRRMVLGGGYAPDDGVFRFKARFSPLRASFSRYRRVHDPAAYRALVSAWSAYHGGEPPPSGFFPAYRGGVEELGGDASQEVGRPAGAGERAPEALGEGPPAEP